jgi:hypothetical protein
VLAGTLPTPASPLDSTVNSRCEASSGNHEHPTMLTDC